MHTTPHTRPLPVLRSRLDVVDAFRSLLQQGATLTAVGEVVDYSKGFMTLAQPDRTDGPERFEPLKVWLYSKSSPRGTTLLHDAPVDEIGLKALVGSQVRVTGHPAISCLEGAIRADHITVVDQVGCLTRWRRHQAAAAGVSMGPAPRINADTFVAKIRAQSRPDTIAFVGHRDLAAFGDVTRRDRVIRDRMITLDAPMQGPYALDRMIKAITTVEEEKVGLVVLARGGGDATILALFDDHRLIRAVRECPVPVLAAIGHSHNTPLVEHACDWVGETPSQLHNVLSKLARNRPTRGDLRRDDHARATRTRTADRDENAMLTSARRDDARRRVELETEVARLREVNAATRRDLERARSAADDAEGRARDATARATMVHRGWAIHRITVAYRTAAVAAAAAAVTIGAASWAVMAAPRHPAAFAIPLIIIAAAIGTWRAPRSLGNTDRRSRGPVPDIELGYRRALTVRQFNKVDAVQRGRYARPTVRDHIARRLPSRRPRRSGTPPPYNPWLQTSTSPQGMNAASGQPTDQHSHRRSSARSMEG